MPTICCWGRAAQSGVDWSITTSTVAWPLGIATVFAVAQDELELESEPATTTLEIVASDNVRPTIGSFITPDFVFKGDTLVLLAANVIDPNNDPLMVDFYVDSNENNAFDDGDELLGSGTATGNDWSLDVDTSSFINGPIRVFVEASDNGIPAYSHVLTADVTIVDVTGPRVLAQTPSASVIGSIDSVSVFFDEPIDVDSFTVSDISSFTGPAGSINIESLEPVPGSDDMEFRTSFARQTTTGIYSLTIDPTLLDLGGNQLDQDGDGVGGEAVEDAYELTFELELPDLAFQWANQLANSNSARIADLKVDLAKNVIITGSFSDTVDFDPGSAVHELTSNGFSDTFVAKYDMDGNFLWARSGGGTSSDLGAAIAIDPAGSVYAVGEYRETATFSTGTGTTSLTTSAGSGGWEDTYIWKLDSNGNTFWLKTIGGSRRDTPHDIAVVGNDVYIVGEFGGTADFDPNPGIHNLTTTENANAGFDVSDAYLLKLNTSGNFVFARAMGGTNNEVARAVAVDSVGSIYTTGSYKSASDFDRLTSGGNVTFSGSVAAFVTKHSSSGALQWVNTIQSHTVRGQDIVIDGNDDLYIAGEHFSLACSQCGPGDFDPGPGSAIETTDGLDAYMTKWNSNGAFQWVHSFTESGNAGIIRGLAIDSTGDIYAAGDFSGDSVAKFDADGAVQWTKPIDGNDETQAIAVVDPNQIHLAGWFDGTIDVDPDPGTINLTTQGGDDGFLVQWRKPEIVNQPPSLALQNVLTTLPEDADVGNRIKVADIVIGDDGLGTNTVSVGGPDASLFGKSSMTTCT